ncbi:hypothetical protein Dimus_025792 [Dionaea muscipula]
MMLGFSVFVKLLISLCLATVVFADDKDGGIADDRASLLSFMSGIDLDPDHDAVLLRSWDSSSFHVCNWTGIVCNGNKGRVVELDLSGLGLSGKISPALGNLSSLKVLDLSSNLFRGQIPAELGCLFQLQQLSLSYNILQGNIPVELGYLNQLVYLNLGSNLLVGQIPLAISCNGSSPSLEYMDLSNNSLTGRVPVDNQCHLTELRFLLLWSNQLVGQVPSALSNSSKLQWLDLGSNFLSGELPSQIICHFPMLQFLYLSYNDFVSHDGNTNLHPFLSSLTAASNLQQLELAGNNLGGTLPPILGDLSTNLVQIHFENNLIHGPIPPMISNLINLTLLNLSGNQLNGSIPPALGKLGKLERLFLSNNLVAGEIPFELGHLTHLGLLDLSGNKLVGSIPHSLASLTQLRLLFLNENKLSGDIPLGLENCVNLEILDLSHNQISGEIPKHVAAGLSGLSLYLNLSCNKLNGPVPLELSKMEMVQAIDLSMNDLNGTVPSQLGSCVALEYLNLSGNHLEGILPTELGQLPFLQVLDMSMNQLTGQIPESLQASSTLNQLNLSFNNFSGYVANEGSFANLTIASFLQNYGLCGSIKGMPRCGKTKSAHTLLRAILLPLFPAPILCFLGYLLRSRNKKVNNLEGEEDMEDQRQEIAEQPNYPRISHRELIEATGGFTSSSLIGSGRFGQVYKGTLRDNSSVAVKVLDSKASRDVNVSFKRECRVLRRTRHRNLIRIITVCSEPDFKAFVFPLMPNGSLERHLYPCSSDLTRNGLDLRQLISICSDVAEAVAYLHHHSPIRIIHCDLKPSNILLDDAMSALVTDFGIARLIDCGAENYANSSTCASSTHGFLCGSVGYITPEYGLGKSASPQGDVYSFGILLLEIATGKRPTDLLFHEGSNLHEWVKSSYPYKLEQIVDQALVRFSGYCNTSAADQKSRDVVVELIELGLMCTQNSPSARPSMLDVAHEMGRLKKYISNHLLLQGDDSKASHSL